MTTQSSKVQEWVLNKVKCSTKKEKKPYTLKEEISFCDWQAQADAAIDQDMKSDLEKSKILNWHQIFVKLIPIKVPRDGNCLLHSAFKAMWGEEDSNNTLRYLLLMTVQHDYNKSYRKRWWRQRVHDFHTIEVNAPEVVNKEWDEVIRSISNMGSTELSAAVPHRFLESVHIYILANILRRPIIILADYIAKSVRGDALQENPIGGLYLPLEWRPIDCCKTPLIFGYSFSHFCPLVAQAQTQKSQEKQVFFPLVNKDLISLPVRYLTEGEDREAWDLIQSYLIIQECSAKIKDTVNQIPCVQLTFKPFDIRMLEHQLLGAAAAGGYELALARKPTSSTPPAERNFHDIQISSQTKLVSVGSAKDHQGRNPQEHTLPKQCVSVNCSKLGDQSQGGLCDTCFKNLTIAESGCELVSRHENGEHYYDLKETVPVLGESKLVDSTGSRIPQPQPPSERSEPLEPTAPFRSVPEAQSLTQPQSMMNERCRTPNCGYRCSQQTFPYCHECFAKEGQQTSPQNLLSFIATAPPPSRLGTESSNEQGSPDLIIFSLPEQSSPTVSTGTLLSNEFNPSSLSSSGGETGTSTSLGSTSLEKVGIKEYKASLSKSKGCADPQQTRHDVSIVSQEINVQTGRGSEKGNVSSHNLSQQPVLNRLSGKMLITNQSSDLKKQNSGQSEPLRQVAFSETVVESSESATGDIEVSEEPICNRKCVSPFCEYFVQPPEQLCRKCTDILKSFAEKDAEQKRKQNEVTSQTSIGTRSIEVQSEKEKQFSMSSPSRVLQATQTIGKQCITPGCTLYGDPKMEKKCSSCYKSSPHKPKVHTESTASLITSQTSHSQPRIQSEQLVNQGEFFVGKGQSKIYQPVDDSKGMYESSTGTHNLGVSNHTEQASLSQFTSTSSHPVSQYHTSNVKPPDSAYASYSVPCPTYNADPFHSIAEEAPSSLYQPSPNSLVVTSMTTANESNQQSHYYQEADREFTKKYSGVESMVKKGANRCKMGTCQNFGSKKGYCNACFRVYQQQLLREREEKYGQDVPDSVVIETT